ncbi:MAG: phosphatase PAP2 family protein [Bacteroidota bacterium]
MLKTIRNNPYFFVGVLLFVISGAILLLTTVQGDVIRFFSEHRSTYGDLFFKYFTKMGEEIIYATAFIILLFVRFRYSLLILLTGFITLGISLLTKAFFAHPRPYSYFYWITKEFDQLNPVEGVDLLVGYTSFPSGHSMSAFAFYGLLAFLLPKKRLMGLLCFTIALLIAVSRMYLIQHFLKDIYIGSLIGVCIALLLYQLQLMIPDNKWLDRSLLGRRQARKPVPKALASQA